MDDKTFAKRMYKFGKALNDIYVGEMWPHWEELDEEEKQAYYDRAEDMKPSE